MAFSSLKATVPGTNRELVRRDNNNFFDFMEAEDYIRLKADACISSKDLYAIYKMWCEENNLVTLKARSFSDNLIANLKKVQFGAHQQHRQLGRPPRMGLLGN